MRRTSNKIIFSVKIFALILALTGQVSPATARSGEFDHWKIYESKDAAIRTGIDYTLQNHDNRQLLVYGEQKYGINLRNVDTSTGRSSNIAFEKQGQKIGTVNNGEPIAILFKTPDGTRYLKYGQRKHGPNLNWSTTPIYEWELWSGPKDAPVKASSFALFSNVEEDFLVHCVRPTGVNLRWLKDKETKGCHSQWGAMKQAMEKLGKKLLKEVGPEAVNASCGLVGGPSAIAGCQAAGVGNAATKAITK